MTSTRIGESLAEFNRWHARRVVNARTADQDALSRSESPPGLGTVAFKTATIALDNYSFETIEFMRELATARKQTQTVLTACQQKLDQCPGQTLPKLAKSLDPYVIEVNFEALADPGAGCRLARV